MHLPFSCTLPYMPCRGPCVAPCCAGVSGPGKLGYVRLATFNSNTTAAAQEALYDLQKQGVAGLVLDIRNNGGGLFPAGARWALDNNCVQRQQHG